MDDFGYKQDDRGISDKAYKQYQQESSKDGWRIVMILGIAGLVYYLAS